MKNEFAALAAIFALGATSLHAAIGLGDVIGTSEDEIRAALEAQGYVVEEITIEDDEIEVEVTLDGVEMEIELSASTGSIVELELDDDEDDDV